jgi:hypothetical protein
MGSGSFDPVSYASAATTRAATGQQTFQYSASMHSSTPRSAWTAKDTLDPKGVTRESRDSDEHPNSVPIMVLFDVTGSMGSVPMTMQTKLPQLFSLLLRRGYVTDPQILFGAIGDSWTDRVPLQVGQFESDNRIDEQLRDIFLEGNGGGDGCEGYEIAAYFAARHTVTDAWEKRGKKGYLFIIGDEKNKRQLTRTAVNQIIGDDLPEDISIEQLYREVQERWETFFILPNLTMYFNDSSHRKHWRDLLGERLLLLDDPDAVCELIATTIGVFEDSIDLDEGLADLTDVGVDAKAVGSVGRALATVGAPSGKVATLPPNLLAGKDDI